MSLTAVTAFADAYEGHIAPQAEFSGDLEGFRFCRAATLTVPKLLQLLERSTGEGAFTHFVVDVCSEFFAEHHDWEYNVNVKIAGIFSGDRLFHKWYRRHQFLIPIQLLSAATNLVELVAEATRSGESDGGQISFEVAIALTAKPRLWENLERSAIWLFSTARSGSTWLAIDVLCSDMTTRPVDELGIGRMFAPLQWDAERFFEPELRHIESGLECNGTTKPRTQAPPIFERAFTDPAQETQVFSRHNFEFYHRMLRDMALEHVLNEWGMFGYERLVFKMPNDSHGADFIMRSFPESHMVFLIRDGRDVMRSRFSPFASPILAETNDPRLRSYAIAYYSHFWNFQVDIMRTAFESHPEHLRIRVHYEDLRQNPISAIGALFRHLGRKIAPDELLKLAERTRIESFPPSERGSDKPRQNGVVGGYRDYFYDDEIATMNAIMGPNLVRYGYSL